LKLIFLRLLVLNINQVWEELSSFTLSAPIIAADRTLPL